MLLASSINSFFPQVFQIGKPFSSLFSSKGTMSIICMMIVLTGFTSNMKSILHCLKSSGILVLIKLLIDIVIGLLLMKYIGIDSVFGISTLAIVACLTSCNPGIYMALMGSNENKEDRTVFILLNIVAVPFIPTCILTYASGTSFELSSILATIIPFVIGMLLGYLFEDCKHVAQSFNAFLLPFLGFCLGTNINLLLLKEELIFGCVLYLIFMLIHLPILYFIEKMTFKENRTLQYCDL